MAAYKIRHRGLSPIQTLDNRVVREQSTYNIYMVVKKGVICNWCNKDLTIDFELKVRRYVSQKENRTYL